jgi:hypothetical protein
MNKRRVAAAVIVTIVASIPAGADDLPSRVVFPTEYLDKVPYTPDLCQTDGAFGALPGGGSYWCCPTAFANVLIAMDRSGYGDLVSGAWESEETQRLLLDGLGTDRYMRTHAQGTDPIWAMRGIVRFVEDRGYDARVAWQGWRRAGEFALGEHVEPEWLREGMRGDSNVVANLGWYTYDAAEDRYTRLGGHYVTLVGYRQSAAGLTVCVHDPAPRSGPGKVTHKARLVPIRSGQLAAWKSYHARSAAGHFRLEGIVKKRTADVAILDGAIRLTISHRE